MSLAKLISDSAKKRKQTLSSQRFDIQQKLFERFKNPRTVSSICAGTQIPKLWCPPIVHYKKTNDGNTEIDIDRNNNHSSYLSDYIGGYLLNGSTGDGWTLNSEQQKTVLINTLDFMHSDMNKYFNPILIGAMKHTYNEKILCLKKYETMLFDYYNSDNLDTIYNKSPFVGFVLTPPSNTNNQKEIEECLADIINAYSGYPFVLYQLPQITNSEMSIETVSNLISRFGNIIMLKDSSGTDTILKSQRCLDGVFMVRGFEGNQMESLMNINYGCSAYNGLLLSTANNYPKDLNLLIENLMNAKWSEAQKISDLMTNVSKQTFGVVEKYDFGNPFTNSAKMVDYIMANGKESEQMIVDGIDIPLSVDAKVYDADDLMTIHDILMMNGIEHVGYKNRSLRQWWKKH